MPFNSPEYLVFYVTILLLSWAVLRLPQTRLWILLLASYYFYASNTHWLLFLLLATTQVDYIAARMIEGSRTPARRKLFLALSLCVNLGVLCTFKYLNFFASSLVRLGALAGLHPNWADLHILLPIGISFYTFESMSYTIDVYRGKIGAERSWSRYALFIAFFPHLIAGPIVRPAFFLPQLDRRPALDIQAFESALFLIFLGLFKKIVLADFLAIQADAAFDHPAQASCWQALLGVYCFAFQIYFDFSGYTDVAIGCARLIGIDLPENFRRPYVATSITDFWRRWHISLSTWLRDYLYVPLGGNRMGGRLGVYRNIMITMLLGGLWHGAAWHFVTWGGLMGLLLVGERALEIGRGRSTAGLGGLRQFGATLVTFHLVCFCWILFRAGNGTLLAEYLRAFTHFVPTPVTAGTLAAGGIVVGGLLAQHAQERRDLAKIFLAFPVPLKASAYALVSVLVTVFGSFGAKPFIYFQF